VGTAKRERQKANRQLRLEELAKQARKDKTKRLGLRIALLVGGVVLLVGGIAIFGGSDDEASPTTTTVAGSVKPEVSIPEQQPVTELKLTPITPGTGEGAKVGDTLQIMYLGYTSADGVEFDNNYDSGQPIPVTLGAQSVIQGWEEGLIGTQAGGRYQLDIPVELAYGADAAAQGRPEGALSFIVDIVSITPGAPIASTTIGGETTTSAAVTATT
jgi:peptidylprolyl isomerase